MVRGVFHKSSTGRDRDEGQGEPLIGLTERQAAKKHWLHSHISPLWDSAWACYTAGSPDQCEWRTAETGAGEPSGPLGPPQSSVSLGSEFWESGPEGRSNRRTKSLERKRCVYNKDGRRRIHC